MRFLRKNNQLISALPPLKPSSIINTRTGEFVGESELNEKIGLLEAAVFEETTQVFVQRKSSLFTLVEGYTGSPQPAEFARQQGIKTNLATSLPTLVKAKSRIEKLVQYKLISETSSYVNNPTPNKQEPSFGHTLNLGAVDKQMASLSVDKRELNLVWKCWDEEYYITFTIPAYVLGRKILGYSLPLIRLNPGTNQYDFIFTVKEEPKTRKGNKHVAGVDLGKVKPYAMAVVNQAGQRVANYEATPRLTRLSKKRERLHEEKQHIAAKIRNRETRGLTSPKQALELERTRDKATRLTKTIAQQTSSEITRLLTKHNANLIHVENLTWVTGAKTSKTGTSKWSHSQQQEAITHSARRAGFTVKKVNPAYSSQVCHKCGSTVTHNQRSVWCAGCKHSLDRDFNAAMNIAMNKPRFLTSQKLSEDAPSIMPQALPNNQVEQHFTEHLSDLPFLARKTT